MENKNIRQMNNEDLSILCSDIRKDLINVVSNNGGHLASNLGVVELTVALHYVFESPKDIMLWDVGHQSYVHKMLTGRKEMMHTIRTYKGLSPFSNPNESEHDHFISGHAGSALSVAFGMSEAEKEKKVIVIVGDASLSNGHSLEAINNIGTNSKNLIVILNDNEMSIGKNVGGLFRYLSKLMSNQSYSKIKEDIETIVRKVSFGNPIADVMKRFEHSIRYFVYPGSFFEELGFNYVGPIDGHNMKELIDTFQGLNMSKGPILLHVKTVKGKGYNLAEKDTEKFHGISPFNIQTGEVAKKGISYSKIFGNKLVELAKKDKNIVAISAAMIKGTGLGEFFELFPDRAYDVGIAEGHAVGFASGLATKGKKPVVAIYSTFLQRGYDQLIHDVGIQNLPVVFVVDRAGIVGEDGITHQGIFDISYLSSIPNFIIISPTTMCNLEQAIEFAVNYKDGPIAIRIPRETSFDFCDTNFAYGKWNEMIRGNKDLIIAAGSMLKEVLNIERKLNENAVYPTIVGASFIKPLDTEYLLENIKRYDNIFVLEDNVLKGGFGSNVLEFLNDVGIEKKIHRFGIPDQFIEHGKRSEILNDLGLAGDNLVKRILEGRKRCQT